MKSAPNKTLDSILSEYSELPDFVGAKSLDINSRSSYGDYLIHAAATRGMIDEVAVLLDSGANINASGEHWFTPLHSAVEQGHVDIVKYLLENGAQLEVKNIDGNTPYDLALILEGSVIAELLNQWAKQ